MSNSLIIIIIPSKTIRKNCKGMFPDFGENPEKTAVAITAQKISYLPLEKEKIEVLILSERKLPLEISSYVNEIVDGKEFIFIGRIRGQKNSTTIFSMQQISRIKKSPISIFIELIQIHFIRD